VLEFVPIGDICVKSLTPLRESPQAQKLIFMNISQEWERSRLFCGTSFAITGAKCKILEQDFIGDPLPFGPNTRSSLPAPFFTRRDSNPKRRKPRRSEPETPARILTRDRRSPRGARLRFGFGYSDRAFVP